MGQIKVEKNVGGIEGLCVIEPAVHGDARGYFMETYNEKQIQLQLSLNYKDRFESASSLAPAQLLWYTYTDCRIDYIMTNKRNPVAKKLF